MLAVHKIFLCCHKKTLTVLQVTWVFNPLIFMYISFGAVGPKNHRFWDPLTLLSSKPQVENFYSHKSIHLLPLDEWKNESYILWLLVQKKLSAVDGSWFLFLKEVAKKVHEFFAGVGNFPTLPAHITLI